MVASSSRVCLYDGPLLVSFQKRSASSSATCRGSCGHSTASDRVAHQAADRWIPIESWPARAGQISSSHFTTVLKSDPECFPGSALTLVVVLLSHGLRNDLSFVAAVTGTAFVYFGIYWTLLTSSGVVVDFVRRQFRARRRYENRSGQ